MQVGLFKLLDEHMLLDRRSGLDAVDSVSWTRLILLLSSVMVAYIGLSTNNQRFCLYKAYNSLKIHVLYSQS
jgi:hypothetical protein